MADVFVEALEDMRRRHGRTSPVPPREHVLEDYAHILETGIFRVALTGEGIAGIAGAVVRDDVWYLSAYWVRPHMQRRHIGMPLLKEVWEEGRKAGASAFLVWSSPDVPALASYMKLGMMPAYDVFGFEGEPTAVPETPPGIVLEPLDQRVAEEIDRLVRGTSRSEDHGFWMRPGGPKGYQVSLGGEAMGYFYVDGGTIGPAAWRDLSMASGLMSAAMAEASSATGTVVLSIPGPNVEALRFALDAGLRIAGFAQVLATDPVGLPQQYIPSGPALY